MITKEEILELLDELVSRIEGPAAEVYAIALQANIRSAILGMAIGGVLTLVGVSALVFAFFNERANAKINTNERDGPYGRRFRETSIAANAIGGFTLLFGTVFFLIAFHDIITIEWTTLHQLVPGL